MARDLEGPSIAEQSSILEMKLFSLKTWRRAMSLVVFLFGATILCFVYLVYTAVPAGTDPRAAGQALAKDPRFALGAIILSGLFLVGLVLAAARLSHFALTTVRERKNPKPIHQPHIPRFSICPVCRENVPFGFLGRDFRGHVRSEHRDYWRWRRRWSVALTFSLVVWMVLLFPLLIYGIIPGARGGATAATGYGLGAYISIEAMLIALGALSSRSRTRKFRREWQEAHPLQVRKYGNLKGIKARVRVKTGRWVDPTLPLGILHPTTLLIGPIIMLLARFSLRRATLDKFEEGRLWLYNAFDTLTLFEVKSLSPSWSNSERVTLALQRGFLEIRTENMSELETIRAVLTAAIIQP